MGFEGKTASPKVASAPAPASSPSGGGGYGGGGGGWGGGGGGGGGNDPDIEDLQAQIDVAGKNYDRNVADLEKATKDTLANIDKQRESNAQQMLMKHNQINRKSDWQPNQQKEQSTYANLRRTMGNAAYGSGLADLNEGMARFDDMADVDLINTWKENQDNAYNNWYQANSDLISDYNNKVNESNQKFASLYNEYVNNVAQINAKIALKALKQDRSGYQANQDEINANKAAAATASAYTAYQNLAKKYNDKKKYKTTKGVVYVKKNGKWKKDTKKTQELVNSKNAWNTANSQSALYTNYNGTNYNVGTKADVSAYAKTAAKQILSAIKTDKALKNALKKVGIKNTKNSSIKKLTSIANKGASGTKMNTKQKTAYNALVKYVQNTAANAITSAQNARINKYKIEQEVEGADKKLTIDPKQKRDSGLTYLTNVAKPNNPNIPDSPTGATDYIRGTNETNRSLAAAPMATPKVSAAANQQYWSKPKNQQWYRAAH